MISTAKNRAPNITLAPSPHPLVILILLSWIFCYYSHSIMMFAALCRCPSVQRMRATPISRNPRKTERGQDGADHFLLTPPSMCAHSAMLLVFQSGAEILGGQGVLWHPHFFRKGGCPPFWCCVPITLQFVCYVLICFCVQKMICWAHPTFWSLFPALSVSLSIELHLTTKASFLCSYMVLTFSGSFIVIPCTTWLVPTCCVHKKNNGNKWNNNFFKIH